MSRTHTGPFACARAGDCCAKSLGKPVQKDYCKQCKCLDPNPKPPKKAACGNKEYKGDGNCDDDNNNAG